QRRSQRFTQSDPHVLDRMVEIDVGVPRGLQVDPEAGVGGERRQPVAEEAVGDLDAPPPAVEAEREPDARLAGRPLNLRCSVCRRGGDRSDLTDPSDPTDLLPYGRSKE